MTTEEINRLSALITGHAAAMQAQLREPEVKLECLTPSGVWLLIKPSESLFGDSLVYQKFWRRLAPAPKIVDLDQSDFLGKNAITHLRKIDEVTGFVASGFTFNKGAVSCSGGDRAWLYSRLVECGIECSRDGGATFQECRKESGV